MSYHQTGQYPLAFMLLSCCLHRNVKDTETQKRAFILMGRKTKRLANALWNIHGSKVSMRRVFETACRSSHDKHNFSIIGIGPSSIPSCDETADSPSTTAPALSSSHYLSPMPRQTQTPHPRSVTRRVHQVGIFILPPLGASPPVPAAALTVFFDGFGSCDEILLSALALGWKRSLKP